MTNLPIFRLRPPSTPVDHIANIFDMKDAIRVEGALNPTLRHGDRVLETYREGGIWMADQSRLWKIPDERLELPSTELARSAAARILAGLGLHEAPAGQAWARRLKLLDRSVGTVAVIQTVADGAREVRQLDVDVTWLYCLELSAVGGKSESPATLIPGVGGGSKIGIRIGAGGSVLAVCAALREIDDIEVQAELIPKEDAEKACSHRWAGYEIVRNDSHLAYYWAPSGVAQRYLVPVYVHQATALVDGREVHLRTFLQPATAAEDKYVPFSVGLPPSAHVASPDVRPRSAEPEDSARRSLGHHPAHSSPTSTTVPSWKAVGYWVTNGLVYPHQNVFNFINRLPPALWSKGGTDGGYGDSNALKSNWTTSEDMSPKGVDVYDLAFYAGHASSAGWILKTTSNTDTTFTPSDGQTESLLKWLVIAACGPLQDSALPGNHLSTSGTLNALTAWTPLFKGLRLLMGYGAVSADVDEGTLLGTYTLVDGMKLADAWLKTGWQVQNPTNGYSPPDGPNVYVSVLAAKKTGDDARDDLLPGSVGAGSAFGSSVIRTATHLVLIATPC